MKIAAIADTHLAVTELSACGKRRTAIADVLLLRTVHLLNRFIKPDVTILLGDLVDSGSGPTARSDLERLKRITDLLKSPLIAIPGNHDGDADAFYQVFERPADHIDIAGARFVSFIDPEEPGYNARRTDADLKRMASAREGHDGPLVSVQHVPLFPAGASSCPYHYVNAAEAWDAFEKNGYTLSLSGHYHAGDDLMSRGAGKAIIAPALCESPFAFLEITIDGDNVTTRRQELRMPPELRLFDYHVHTPFAFCQENMDYALTIELAREFGLAGFAFCEHTGQLYFDRPTFWAAGFMEKGLACEKGVQIRMPEYLARTPAYCPPAYLGFEIDCDYSGTPVIRPEDAKRAQVRLGAVHWLEELRKPDPDLAKASDEMLRRLSKFLGSGLDILAHPFRAFKQTDIPEGLAEPMVDLLRINGVAAEINFHIGEVEPEFVGLCVESGVKLVFGSDSHNLFEVGQFAPHLELMRTCGYGTSDLPEILADIRPGADVV